LRPFTLTIDLTHRTWVQAATGTVNCGRRALGEQVAVGKLDLNRPWRARPTVGGAPQNTTSFLRLTMAWCSEKWHGVQRGMWNTPSPALAASSIAN
jgi:hypothetical protein